MLTVLAAVINVTIIYTHQRFSAGPVGDENMDGCSLVEDLRQGPT